MSAGTRPTETETGGRLSADVVDVAEERHAGVPDAAVEAQVEVEVDVDEANTNQRNPLVPRPIDLPTVLPLDGDLEPEVGDIAKIFAAPDDPAEWPAWRQALARWRDEAHARLGYDGTIYDRAETSWTRSCYSVAQVWLWDERLFDRATGRFSVDRLLDATADLGGFDGVVLWHAYPVIGIDDRNQFDFYRDVPGLVELVAELHGRGIRVFVDYNPWDTGTRRAARDDAAELALVAGELGVDGVFLDTMKEGDSRLIDTLSNAEPPLVLEGESRVPNQRIEDHQLSWAQWFADSRAPGVMRAHWFEQRHMMHSTRRWNRDHSDELQSAFLNGTGMLVWDTVFGVWVGWNERDKTTLRRMLRVQRALADVFSGGEWTPLVDATGSALAAGVYASRFELGPVTVWTLVNRGEHAFTGEALDPAALLPAETIPSDATSGAGGDGVAVFDVTSGVRLGTSANLVVPARGVAAVVRVRGDEPGWLAQLLADAAGDTAADASRDSSATDATFPAREAVRRVPERSTGEPPADAVRLTAGERELPMTYRRRETGSYQGAPYVEEWKPLAPRLHDPRTETHRVRLGDVAVAAREVTDAEFAAFLAATGYRPATANRFLTTWSADGRPPGEGAASVTHVGLDDARAFAAWAGARLPTEFEWQAAAGEPGFERAEPLVWNWTESEHDDGITRFVMLKGGSDHESLGSDWYTDGGPRSPEFSLKLLLPGLGLERSPSIGFRLAWDLGQPGAAGAEGQTS
ncbi:formylglycine-generating enzyme family protein [Herbiconiux daphne]|uniref:Formylglycine-generating enzyme family protein n=1 Tax=Herbiconiux daphne TaxID=2970914 RepID=A0ABT2GXW6_9MICO|nr:formylglycine-generating enzyme family protein [Herbiconiux daphne]MCS5732804.1 formylglycine-generating enzyme family protein [Herbiconiux daphne]